MSFPPPVLGVMKAYPTKVYHDGPAAHEDLTIGEHLDTLRVTEESRPEAQCYLNPKGENCWFSDAEVESFIARHGADHPAEYFAAHQVDWLITFFNHA